jgi:glutathione S-transferase
MMLRRKWNARSSDAEAESRMIAFLDELRAALKGHDFLDGAFSFADIAAVGVLQAVKPVDDRYIRLGPGTRETWTNRQLERDYGDLLAWRDRVYEKHGFAWKRA